MWSTACLVLAESCCRCHPSLPRVLNAVERSPQRAGSRFASRERSLGLFWMSG